jgi:hypothetical protein
MDLITSHPTFVGRHHHPYIPLPDVYPQEPVSHLPLPLPIKRRIQTKKSLLLAHNAAAAVAFIQYTVHAARYSFSTLSDAKLAQRGPHHILHVNFEFEKP